MVLRPLFLMLFVLVGAVPAHATEPPASPPAQAATEGEQEAAQMAARLAREREAVCRVNGHDITQGDVDTEQGKLLPWTSYHGSIDATKRAALRRQALQKAIDRELKFQDAMHRGIRVRRKELKKLIAEVVAKYPDEETFKETLAKAGLTKKDVELELRRRKMIERVEAKVVKADQEVSEEEARKYYEEHRERFKVPRQAVVRELIIRVPILGRTEAVWEKAKAKAEGAFVRIESGEAFAALVREMSDVEEKEKEAGGLLGPIHQGRFTDVVDKVLWALPEGGVSKPIKTLRGFYLFKVDRYIAPHQVPFEEVKEPLRKDLQRTWSKERRARWMEGLHQGAKIEYLLPELVPVAGEKGPAVQ